MNIEELLNRFYSIYGNRNDNPVLFFSPGRVNLIGEHTDYNYGYVFPCALNFGTYLLARKRSDDIISLNTINFDYSSAVPISQLEKNTDGEWVNYPVGVIKEFISKNILIGGIDLLYYGDIPNGAGLSSSASIEMVTAVAMNELFEAGQSTLDMVKMCQKAENNFVGMNCGIMDQFAVGFGEKNKAILLNCESLDYEAVPIVLNNYQLVITNTNKRRGLTDSKYNERRSECEKAVNYLAEKMKIENLGQVTFEQIDMIEELITDPIVKKRARHVISENARVIEAVNVLKAGELDRFGELMNQSHDSLKDDYDVTGIELDTLVYEARKLKGVIGSRMTGAGFGGCTVSIIDKSETDRFIQDLGNVYFRETGLKAEFYLPFVGDGARRLQIH